MEIIALIDEPEVVRRFLTHLRKTGKRTPPEPHRGATEVSMAARDAQAS